MRWARLVLVALALAGCETTAEKSAKLERAAKLQALRHPTAAAKGLSIPRASAVIKVVNTALVHSSEAAAAVVTLRNTSARTLREVPIEITVKDAGGRTLFQNTAAGLETALVSVAALPPHGEITWVDDQVPVNGHPATVSAVIGEGPAAAGNVPVLAVKGVHLIEDPANGAGAAGSVSNPSHIAQRSVVVFAVARRAGSVVAAGRAVLPEVPAGGSTPFQAFFIGDAHGAQLQASAPTTTFR